MTRAMTGRAMKSLRILALAALLGVLPHCGAAGSGISSNASATLSGQVAGVRAAAGAQDWASARSLLAQLRASVATLRAQGAISTARSASILTSVASVEAQLPALPAAPPAAPSPTPSPAPPPAAGPGGHHPKGKDG